MDSATRSASRRQVLLAFCLACSGGCGPRYEMPEPPPREHAAPDTFTIRSLTLNGREIADGNAGEVTADQSVELKGEIDFRKGRPHPPMVYILFEDESGDRPVIHGTAAGRLGASTARGTPFTVSDEAPKRSGTYTLWVTAMPPKSTGKQSRADGDRRPLVYAQAELTVVDGE